MAKLKPIEKLANDVRRRDLVRIELEGNNEYTGYYEGELRGTFEFRRTLRKSSYMASQFEGSLQIASVYKDCLSLGTNTVCNHKIKGYEVLRRAKKK